MISNTNSNPLGNYKMKITPINQYAKLLRDRQYKNRIVPDKRKSKLNKLAKKEMKDGKTRQDT
jgi:hypothetical protein